MASHLSRSSYAFPGHHESSLQPRYRGKWSFMNISVVIPTYIRCELLRRALLSVFSQTLLPTEVVVIDDGSTDGTNP